MSLTAKLLSASGGGADKLYVDDVFSTYLYTGNGSTQTINNGIDLAGKGGLVWTKCRQDLNSSGAYHGLFDTARGVNKWLQTNGTLPSQNLPSHDGVSYFNSNGFTVGLGSVTNDPGEAYVSWTFRKAPKFFDVVTYTGDGTSYRQIAHALDALPGLVIIKRTDSSSSWTVACRNNFGNYAVGGYLNQTFAFGKPSFNIFNNTAATFEAVPWLPSESNVSGATYVAYLFAHDPSPDGIIQCGSFTTSAGNTFTTTLGWEPQYVLFKSSNSADDWRIADSFRGFTAEANQRLLSANTEEAEVAGNLFALTATGFAASTGISNLPANTSYIYLAIRRPNKPPTSGTQVYNAIARTGTGAAATVTGVGFAPDLVSIKIRAMAYETTWEDRLRGANKVLSTESTGAEISTTQYVTGFDIMDGVNLGADVGVNNLSNTYSNHFFRRAPGFFDVVCYTGTGVARTVPHGLGVAPELMIVKIRTWAAGRWVVYHAGRGIDASTLLNVTDTEMPGVGSVLWNSTPPTNSVFSLGTNADVNGSSYTHVAYLFATKTGISKVGSYTGNGSSQTINCGFTTGARFILIKRTDSTGDWYVWDSARGIVSGNDPHLSLNTTAAEVTSDDSVDPAASGFIVNQVATTNINVSGGTYIFLAIA